MAEQSVSNQWQLQDTGESLEQWKLQDNEQRLPAHMELQDDYDSPELIDAAWQPIDYRAMQAAASGKSRRGGAALGALLVVALVGVGAYLAWFYINGQGGTDPIAAAVPSQTTAEATDPGVKAAAPVDMSNLNNAAAMTDTTAAQADPAPEAAPPAQAAEAVDPVAPVVEPLIPAQPTTLEVRQAVVNSPLGVNMRASAAATGALIATLDDKTQHVVASGPTADATGATWYELALPDKSRGWVSGEFITVTLQTLPFADAEQLLVAVGITPTVAAALPVAESVVSTVTASTPVTTSPAPGAADEPTVRLSAVISAPAGLNLRRSAESGDNVIKLLEGATALSVIGRSADGYWAQVELADNQRGWLATEYLSITGDINTIPLGTSLPLTPTVTSGLGAAAIEPAASIAPTVTATLATSETTAAAPLAAPAGDIGAGTAFTVTSIMGVNVRAEPSNDSPGILTLSWSTSGDAVGRTADNEWVRVTIPSGQSGWVAAKAVSLSDGIAALAVVE